MLNLSLIFTITIAIFIASFDVLANGERKTTSVLPVQTCNSANLMLNTISNINNTFVDNHFQKLGQAKLSVLFWDIYESELLTSDGQLPFSSVCQHTLFKIRYLRDISKEELLESTEKQWRHLKVDKSTYTDYLTILTDVWPDIKAGDQLSFLNQGPVTVFYYNQEIIAEIDSVKFGHLFLRIWLDENTSEPKLRQQLLGEIS